MAEGSLDFEARIRLAEEDLSKIKSQLRTISTGAEQQGSQLDKAFSMPLKNIAKLAGGLGAGYGLQQFTKQLINVRGEFQKLEVAFETMLGSKEKSDEIMRQAVELAATTPFDLQGVTNGYKQLLAYGVEMENVTDTMTRLGNVAAGLSIPLNDLVYLFGTTRAQGRLYTQDLNQFTGRGIPMIGELAKQFGVAESEIREMVEAGKVGFPEVQKVIQSLTNEGGMFYNLMEKQSKTLSGQISNLEDSFQQMFNEIGQNTEGILSGGISIVASLVENYEKVGKVLLSLVATYGAYKAAVIAVSVAEKVRYQATLVQMAGMTKMQAITDILRAKMALLNKTMLANPFVLATTAVVALAAAFYSLAKAQTAAEKGQQKYNDDTKGMADRLDEMRTKANEYLSVIQDTNQTDYARTKAYEDLGKIMPQITEQYTQQELAAANAANVTKEFAGIVEEMSFEESIERLERFKNLLQDIANAGGSWNNLSPENFKLLSDEFGHGSLQEKEKEVAEYVKSLQESVKKTEQTRKQAEWNALTIEQKISIKTQEKSEVERQFKEAKQKWEEYLAKIEAAEANQDPLDMTTYVQRDYVLEFQLRSNFEYFKNRYEQLENDYNQLVGSEPEYENIQVVTKKLITTEQAVSQARSRYASSGSETDKKALEDSEKDYKELTDKYKAMTDQSWVTAKQIAENRIKLEQETTKALLQQQIEQTANKKEQLRLQYEAELAAIDQSEREFKKNNRGATSGSFDTQRQMAKTDYEINVKVIDDEWQAFMKQLQEGTARQQEDAQLEALQRELSTATDLTRQLELQEEIRQRMLQQDLSEIDKEETEAVKKAEESGQSTENVTAEFDKRRKVATEKSDAEGIAEKLRLYEEYANKVIEIEQRKNEQIQAISKSKDLTPEQKQERTQQVIDMAEYEQASSFGGDAAEVISGDMAGIVQQVMAMSMQQLMAQIPILKAELDKLKKSGADSGEIITVQTQLLAAEKELEKQSGKLGDTSDDTADTMKEKYKAAADVLRSVNDVCDTVSDSFGDLLGEAGKDALDVIKTITSSVIGVITAMQSTAVTASASVSAVEKASVILTIISLAVQAIMAIVNVMTKYFSKNAQTQKQIDAQKEKIEGLQEQYDELERTQKGQTGRKYWETQIELSKNLKEQIAELDEAIRLAEEQAAAANTKGKKEDAEEQAEDLKQQRNDAIDEEREAMQEFYDELATTDLSSFSESLAESIVDGWESGLDGMGEAWDNAMDDLMRDMLTKQLSLDLQEKLKGVFDRINKSFGENDTELSKEEIEAIQAEYEAAKQSAEEKANAYKELYDSLGLGDESEEDLEGSSGGFESMSQDTADELNGRFTAIQISTASIDTKMDTVIQGNGQLLSAAQQFCEGLSLIAGIADNQLTELRQINENTAVLSEMNVKLKRIEENTSRL